MRQFCKLLITLFVIVLFLLTAKLSFGQIIINNSGSKSVLQREPNRQVTDILIVPVYSDTTTATARMDSLGMIVQIRSSGKWYKRDTANPGHKWTEVAGGGGGGSFDSTFWANKLNLKVDSITLHADTAYYWTNGTRHFGFKSTISQATLITVLGYAPLAVTDTTYLLSSRFFRQKGLDSIMAVITSLLNNKKDKSDSTGATSYVPRNQLDTFKTNVYAALAARMVNYGSAPGQLQGTFTGIPSPASYSNGTTYIAQDSGFLYVDTGSGATRGWKKILGGAGVGGGGTDTATIIQAPLNVTRAGNKIIIGADSLAKRLLPTERVLYNANNWTTSDIAYYFSYTGSGSELNSVGGKIVLTGGTQTMAAGNNTAFNKVLKLNWYGGTLLPYVKITTVYRVNGTLNSTSAGIATGQYSINALGSLSHMMAWTNTTTTGTGTTYAVLGSSNTAMDASASAFAYASTQQIMQIVERVGDKVFISSKNLTTDSPMVQTVHQWDGTSAVNGITPNVPNTGMFGWANLSGAEIDSICITTRCPYGAPLGVFTDSKGLYSVPSDVSLAAQIQRFYPGSVLCYGPTDGIRDLRARQREIDTVLHPLQSLVVSIPRNEYAFGVNEFTITRPACISYDSAVRANGIISIWTDGIFENQTTQNGLTYFIDSAFGTPVNQYGPKLIKTKNVGALVANVAKDNIHVSIAGAYNNARTMFASGKIIDYSQRINSVYSTDDNWSRWIDSTKTLSLDMAFGNYRPDTYNMGDILVREGAAFTGAFGTPAQKNRWVIVSSADASAEIQNWTGGNVATTQAFKIKTTTVTGVTPTTKFGIWEDGRGWMGSVTPFRLYHSAANTMDFYFGGGIAGGTNQTDSTDGGVIPYNSLGMVELYSYGRAGGVTFKLPTSNNTVRRYINAFGGGRFMIGDSVDNAVRMFTLKGSGRIFKDSLFIPTTVYPTAQYLGIDSTTGDIMRLPQINLTPYRLITDTVAQTGTATNGHLKKVADSLAALFGGGGGGSGTIRVSPIDSLAKSANGIQISLGKDLVPQTADASFPGLVSTAVQTFAGVKTFTSVPKITGALGSAASTDSILAIKPDGTLEQTSASKPVGVGNIGKGWPILMVRNDSLIGKTLRCIGCTISSETDSTIDIDITEATSYGAYIPTSSGNTNVASVTIDSASYTKQGPIVTGRWSGGVTATIGSTAILLHLTLPTTNITWNSGGGFGTGIWQDITTGIGSPIRVSASSATEAVAQFIPTSSNGGAFVITFQYDTR